MKKILFFCAALLCCLALPSCCGKKAPSFPEIKQDGKIAIVAHRGYWNCEEAGFAQNSIASLKAAQDHGLWGSEFDIHLTKDGQVLVFHDNAINGTRFNDVDAAYWADYRLPNGEPIPTLDEYLTQGEKSDKTVLVCEIKSQFYPEQEPVLVAKTVEALKAHGLFHPDRVIFISFSWRICDIIAREYPEFSNQYLGGGLPPARLAQDGINGFDYERKEVWAKPEWIEEAHALGMSTNVWTLNKEEHLKHAIELGIDAITTNEPLLTRSLLGDREFKR